MNCYNFYDTSSLLKRVNTLFETPENIVISSITLLELENIKTSSTKDLDIKYAARKLISLLSQNFGKYEVIIYKNSYGQIILDKGLPLTNDNKILSCAVFYDNYYHPDETNFITDDLSLFNTANLFFGEDMIHLTPEEEDKYTGYKAIKMNDEDLSELYTDNTKNKYNLLTNEYLLVKNQDNEFIDYYRWNGFNMVPVRFKHFDSCHFGNIKPYKNDPYQLIAMDSMATNKVTMVKGPAGSGKTLLSLGYLFSLLESYKIDKIIIFCNTIATKNSAKLGFYPGSRDEKLLDSQIGNLLISKLGDRLEVEKLINNNQLVLLPFSDIRGYDTSGMNAGIYISEAQNLDVDLMKLALQRIGEDSICIIDGDEKTQVDDIAFAGVNNGMRRVSKIFRGEDIYGEVELNTIHRSKIAEIAEKL